MDWIELQPPVVIMTLSFSHPSAVKFTPPSKGSGSPCIVSGEEIGPSSLNHNTWYTVKVSRRPINPWNSDTDYITLGKCSDSSLWSTCPPLLYSPYEKRHTCYYFKNNLLKCTTAHLIKSCRSITQSAPAAV